MGVLKTAILRYEVVYWADLDDGTHYQDVVKFDTLKEARAYVKHHLPDYQIIKEYRDRLYNGYGFTHYVGDAKILYCEKRPIPPRADPEPIEYPDAVLQQIGGWY